VPSRYARPGLLLLLLLSAPAAFPFAGKIRPPKDIARVWAEDRLERTLALYALVNETPGTNDWLRFDIPRTLALSLQATVAITIPANMAQPVLRGLEAYNPLTFTVGASNYRRSPQASTNIVFFSDVATNTNLAYILTNGEERTVLRDRSNTIYLDPMRSDWNASNLLPGQFLWTNHGISRLPPRLCFQETNGWRRTLRVIESLYDSGAVAPADLFARVNADFHLTGTLADLGENRVRLRLALIDRNRKSVQPLLDRVLVPERWVEETATVAPLLLALLQERELVTNLVFTSKPEGAYVYLGGRFAGSTPLTLDAWPAGPVHLRVWHQKAAWDLDAQAAQFGARCLSNTGEELIVRFRPEDSGATNVLPFTPPKKAGTLRVSVGGVSRSDIWLDGELVASGTNAFESLMEVGPHAVAVRASRLAPVATAPSRLATTVTPTTNTTTIAYATTNTTTTAYATTNTTTTAYATSNATATANAANHATATANAMTNATTPPNVMTNATPIPNSANIRTRNPAWDFQDRLFQINIRQDSLTELSLKLKPVRRISGFESVFLDPDRNTVIFGSLSLVGAAAVVYSLLRRGEFEERARLANARGDISGFAVEGKAYSDWNDTLIGCAIAGGSALALTLVFRVVAISRQEIRIETEFRHGPDVKLTWKSEF
jgi:hypothetical protein